MNCPACGCPNFDDAARCESCGVELTSPTVMDGAPRPVPATEGLAPGSKLGTRYVIQEMLGQGGMGAVYKAHDNELNRTIAIKVIRPEFASRPDVLERFKREILLASKVTHKHVLRIHDFGAEGDLKFISMNYVEGASLNVVLEREGPMPVERALPLVKQIGEALQAAHEAGVVHRDLKPQNILIDRKGDAYIVDFGISHSVDSGGTITEAGYLMGTVAYMSPEQARGERPDHRSDLYSFGLIVFQILTGTLPFTGGDALSALMKRAHDDAPTVRQMRPQVPGWISEIVARALRRDPADRYQSVKELLRDLDRRHPSASWHRIRRRFLVPALAILGIATAVVLGIRYWRAKPSAPAAPLTSLVILPFRNDTGDPHYDWARDGLPSLLRGELMEAKELRLIGEDRAREVLATLRAAEGEESTPSNMRRIAALIGADNVLSGRLLKTADTLRIEVRLQPAGTQDASGPPLLADGDGDKAIQPMLDELTPRVWEALGVSHGWLERARSSTKPGTTSAEALADYGRALSLIRVGSHLDASAVLEAAVKKDPSFSMARAVLAETYDALGYSDKAAAEAKNAAAGLGSASPYEAARIRATLARIEGDSEAAEKAYESLCEITPSDAEVFFELASIREEGGNLPGAKDAFQHVVALDPKHPSAHFALGRLLFKLGDPAAAIEELNVALRLHDETNNDEGKATVLNGLGGIDMHAGKYDGALVHYQGSLGLRRKIGDQKGVRATLTNIAIIYARLGRYKAGIEAAQEAVAIARKIGDRRGLGTTCSGMGDVYQMAGQPEEAMKAYQESLKIFREKGVRDAAGEARAIANIGAANSALGRYVEGVYALKDALAKRREIGNKAELIQSLSDIGDNERVQGGYDEALKYYTEGLTLTRETGDKALEIVFLESLSTIHEDQGDYGAALSLLAEAEKSGRETKDASLATTLSYLGRVRGRLGDLAGAEAALNEALPLARDADNTRLIAETAVSQAALCLARGERDRAATASREGLQAATLCREPALVLAARLQSGEAARSIRDLASVASEAESAGLLPLVGAVHLALARVSLGAGKQREALSDALSAIAAATKLGQRDLLFQAHHLAGKALLAQNDRTRAAEHFRAATSPLDEMRRGLTGEPLKAFLNRPDIVEFSLTSN